MSNILYIFGVRKMTGGFSVVRVSCPCTNKVTQVAPGTFFEVEAPARRLALELAEGLAAAFGMSLTYGAHRLCIGQTYIISIAKVALAQLPAAPPAASQNPHHTQRRPRARKR